MVSASAPHVEGNGILLLALRPVSGRVRPHASWMAFSARQGDYPGILTYSKVGNGPANIIDGNVIWNTNDFSIQSAADSIIRNNINPEGIQ